MMPATQNDVPKVNVPTQESILVYESSCQSDSSNLYRASQWLLKRIKQHIQ